MTDNTPTNNPNLPPAVNAPNPEVVNVETATVNGPEPVATNATRETVTPTSVSPRPRRGGPRVFTLIVGVVSLLACVYALTDGAIGEYAPGFSWWLAGAALLAGILILASTFRPNRKNR